jgi:hypothetical protein
LDRLSEANRDILLLRAQDGLTYREIGAAVGIERENVKKRYYRTVRQLKQAMQTSTQPRTDVGGKRRPFSRAMLISGFSSLADVILPVAFPQIAGKYFRE